MDVNALTVRLQESGVMSSSEVAAFQATLPSDDANDASRLAQALVRQKRLTEYQAEILRSGGRVRFGEYVVLDKIGQGGMGVVFKAERRGAPDVVALKVLPPDLVGDAAAVGRFRREVEAVTRLKHPHIVAALDSGEDQGTLYLVMEYVRGHNLADLVRTHGPLPVGTAVNCVLHAAGALEYAHGQGVIHRDIKPSNLILDRNETVRVLDMGLARLARRGGDASDSDMTVTDITKTGTVLGTVDYMAPEQALNTKHADHRSDVYGLGSTLHFLLTGEAPYAGETVMEKLVAHREHPIPSVRAAREDVPERLDGILRRMLAKSRDDRHQSMAELCRDLESCKGEFGLTWLIQRVKKPRGRR